MNLFVILKFGILIVWIANCINNYNFLELQLPEIFGYIGTG